MKKFLVFGVAFLTILSCSWALLHPGFFRVHDYVHAARIAEMLRGFQEGQLPVRWSSNFGYGYGMPLFEFYAPLPFMGGAGLLWLGINVVIVIKLLYVLANVFTFSGAFLLGKKLYGRLGGLVTAVAYTLAPYRAVNLYVRGAVSEAWAMIALPWIMLGIVMVLQKNKRGFWVLLAGLVVLLLSHNLTTMLFLPVSVLLGGLLFFTLSNEKKSTPLSEKITSTLPIIAAYLLAIGICAFYLFPAFLEKDFTKINSIFSGYFHYSNHFLYIRQLITPYWGYGGSNWGPDDGLSFFLGLGQLAAGVLAAVMWLFSAVKKRSPRRLVWMAGLVALMAVAAFMTLLRSKPLWDAIPLLTIVQFPWRWLSIVSFLLALIAGAGVSLITNKRYRITATVILVVITVSTTVSYFRPESYMSSPEDLYYTDPDKIRREMSQILPDYIPITMADKLPPRTEVFLIPEGVKNDVEVIIDRGHQKLFKTNFFSPTTLNPLVASYPGWTAEIDGEVVPLQSNGQYGTLSIDVPAGEHLVNVSLGKTPVRAISDAVSAISIITMLGVATYVGYRRTTT